MNLIVIDKNKDKNIRFTTINAIFDGTAWGVPSRRIEMIHQM